MLSPEPDSPLFFDQRFTDISTPEGIAAHRAELALHIARTTQTHGGYNIIERLKEFEKYLPMSKLTMVDFRTSLEEIEKLYFAGWKSVTRGLLDDARKRGEFLASDLISFEQGRRNSKLSYEELNMNVEEMERLGRKAREFVADRICADHQSLTLRELRDQILATGIFDYLDKRKQSSAAAALVVKVKKDRAAHAAGRNAIAAVLAPEQ